MIGWTRLVVTIRLGEENKCRPKSTYLRRALLITRVIPIRATYGLRVTARTEIRCLYLKLYFTRLFFIRPGPSSRPVSHSNGFVRTAFIRRVFFPADHLSAVGAAYVWPCFRFGCGLQRVPRSRTMSSVQCRTILTKRPEKTKKSAVSTPFSFFFYWSSRIIKSPNFNPLPDTVPCCFIIRLIDY